jgi:hypothetical protein
MAGWDFKTRRGFSAMIRGEKKILSLGPAAGPPATLEIPAANPRRPPGNGFISKRENRCEVIY